MGSKLPTAKSVVRRGEPTLETVSEIAVVSASTTPGLAIRRSEEIPLKATAGRVKSSLERVEKGFEKRETSTLSKQSVSLSSIFALRRCWSLPTLKPQSSYSWLGYLLNR